VTGGGQPGPFGKITAISRLMCRSQNAMKPGIHCARTHWIRGFMTFRLARRTRTVGLMVSAWPEFGFRGRAARLARVSWDVNDGRGWLGRQRWAAAGRGSGERDTPGGGR
jgi:hypothetical protein